MVKFSKCEKCGQKPIIAALIFWTLIMQLLVKDIIGISMVGRDLGQSIYLGHGVRGISVPHWF